MKFILDQSQVSRVLPHVIYEIAQFRIMLRGTASALTTSPPDDTATQNARLESLLVHTRNLIDFLGPVPTERSNDDVYAGDFGFVATEPAAPEHVKQRVNKYVQHLTYSRIDGSVGTTAWNLPDLAAVLLPVIRAFVHHVVGAPPVGIDGVTRESLRRLALSMVQPTATSTSRPCSTLEARTNLPDVPIGFDCLH